MRNKRIIGLLFTSTLFLVCAGGAIAQDWPQWRGPDRTGAAMGGPKLIQTLPSGRLPILWWSEPIPDTLFAGEKGSDVGYSSPVASDGRVYLYVNQKVNDTTPLRLTWGVRNRLGCFDPPLEEDLARKVEAARNSGERAALGSDAVPAWARDWVAHNLTHALYLAHATEIEDRLIRGPEAVDLGVLKKLEALKDQTYPSRDELEKALTDTGLDAQRVMAIAKDLTAHRMRALDILFCFDAASGKTLWKMQAPGAMFEYGTSSTPCIVGDNIFVSGGKTIYCLNAKDGTEIWQAPCPGKEVSSSPIVADGILVIQAGALCGLDAKDGKLLWTRTEFKGIHASPATWRKDGKTYVVPNGGLVELQTGNLMWDIPGINRNGDASPVVCGDCVVICGGSIIHCYRLAVDKPQELWNRPYQNGGFGSSTPVIFQDHLYGIEGQAGPLFCADMANGKVLWTSPEKENYGCGSFNNGSCIIVDGKVIIDGGAATKQGQLFYLVNAIPDKFDLLATGLTALGNLRCSNPVVADGRLFLRAKDALVCYDLTAK